MLDVNEDDIDRRCGHGLTEAGRRYHKQARVVEFSREGDTMRPAVKGSERAPYRQTITLTQGRRGVDIAGRCSCPVKSNCKHVAAALFHAITMVSGAKAAGVWNPQPQPAARPNPIGTGSDGTVPPAGPSLPPEVHAWLDDIAWASEATGEDYPPDVTQRMIYVLVPIRDDPRMPQLGVQPVSARLRNDGTFASNNRPYRADMPTPAGPRYFRPSDSRIIRDLSRLPVIHALTVYRLTDDVGAEVLARILETDRARWLTLDGPTIRTGPARRGSLSWSGSRRQRASAQADDRG